MIDIQRLRQDINDYSEAASNRLHLTDHESAKLTVSFYQLDVSLAIVEQLGRIADLMQREDDRIEKDRQEAEEAHKVFETFMRQELQDLILSNHNGREQ